MYPRNFYRQTAADAVAASNFPSDVMSGWVCDNFLLECVMGVSAFCTMTFENTGKKNAKFMSYREEFSVSHTH
jgi:hypothetical protein